MACCPRACSHSRYAPRWAPLCGEAAAASGKPQGSGARQEGLWSAEAADAELGQGTLPSTGAADVELEGKLTCPTATELLEGKNGEGAGAAVRAAWPREFAWPVAVRSLLRPGERTGVGKLCSNSTGDLQEALVPSRGEVLTFGIELASKALLP